VKLLFSPLFAEKEHVLGPHWPVAKRFVTFNGGNERQKILRFVESARASIYVQIVGWPWILRVEMIQTRNAFIVHSSIPFDGRSLKTSGTHLTEILHHQFVLVVNANGDHTNAVDETLFVPMLALGRITGKDLWQDRIQP
jgi:hypothetical protein